MSDNLTNRSTLAGAMPTIIAPKAVYYYEKLKVVRGLLGAGSQYMVPDGAKSITVNQLDYLTFAATTEATAQDSEAFTLGNSAAGRVLTPVMVGANVLVGLESVNSGGQDINEMFAEAAATAWAAYDDTALCALYGEAPSTGPDHEIGTDATALTAAIVRQGVSLLMAAGAKQPYNYVIDPIQFNELMADAEAKQYLRDTRSGGMTYAATTGVSMDRYLGQIYGCNIWVANALAESSGLHSIMFGQGAMGVAYKMLSSELSPGSSLMLADVQYLTGPPRYRCGFYVMQHCLGTAFSATTNAFMVDIIS